MKKDTKTFLDILFNPGEQIYASPDKYSSSKNKDGTWRTYRESVDRDAIDEENTILVGINPIFGIARNDKNVTAFRSFLFEIDKIPSLREQRKYIEESGVPFSMCVFSGNKSLHYCLTLDEDLPNIETYKLYSKWILRTLPIADQDTQNPSRAIRFPGPIRPDTGKNQVLVQSKGRVPFDQLRAYLSQFPELMPQRAEKKLDSRPVNVDIHELGPWVKRGLTDGFVFEKGRNAGWFAAAFDFGRASFTLEDTVSILQNKFDEEDDFLYAEWLVAVTKGFNKGRASWEDS